MFLIKSSSNLLTVLIIFDASDTRPYATSAPLKNSFAGYSCISCSTEFLSLLKAEFFVCNDSSKTRQSFFERFMMFSRERFNTPSSTDASMYSKPEIRSITRSFASYSSTSPAVNAFLTNRGCTKYLFTRLSSRSSDKTASFSSSEDSCNAASRLTTR